MLVWVGFLTVFEWFLTVPPSRNCAPFWKRKDQVPSPWQIPSNLTLRSVTEKLLVLLKEVNMGLRQHKPWAGIGQEIAHRLTTYSHLRFTCRVSYLESVEIATCIWLWLRKQLITTCGVKLPYQSSERSHERRDLLHNLTGIKTIQTHPSTAMAPFLPCSLYRASLWCLEPLWACQHEGSNVRCTKVNHAKRMEKKGKGFTMLQASSSYISLSLTVVLTFSKAVFLHIFSSAGNVVTPTGLDTQLPSWNTQICLS